MGRAELGPDQVGSKNIRPRPDLARLGSIFKPDPTRGF